MEKLPLPARIVHPLGYPHVETLSEEQQKGLRSFWLDGLFASLAGGFTDVYYTLYLLSLQATNAQIGLVNTLNQLLGAVMAMPGAAIADRTGRYRAVSWLAGLGSRLMWPVMILAPWVLDDQKAVWIVIMAWVVLAGMGTLGNAAWTALSAELVPSELRGSYFSSRNIIMQFVLLLSIPTAGLLVNVIGEPGGFQFNFGLAFAFGAVSLYFYGHIPEHLHVRAADRLSTRQVLRRMTQMPTFMRFVTAHAVLLLGVMLGGPFITVYMDQKAGFSIGVIGLVNAVGTLATLVSMRLMGRMYDRLGIIGSMRFGIFVPLIPVIWLWVHHPWQAYLVNSVAALTWAGYNLGAFNLLLASTPNEHRPRYVAVYTTIVSVASAIGPAVGGALLDKMGFSFVFSLSCIVRALGFILFLALVRDPERSVVKGLLTASEG